MKYKTYVNNMQIFGDGYCYDEWINFIRSQGIEVDKEKCYEGDITDFMGAVEAMESILLRLHRERETLREETPDTTKKCLFDLSYIPKRLEQQKSKPELDPRFYMSPLDLLMEATENTYCFLPYTFYMACKDRLEPDFRFSKPGHFKCWKLKDGAKIHVKASPCGHGHDGFDYVYQIDGLCMVEMDGNKYISWRNRDDFEYLSEKGMPYLSQQSMAACIIKAVLLVLMNLGSVCL